MEPDDGLHEGERGLQVLLRRAHHEAVSKSLSQRLSLHPPPRTAERAAAVEEAELDLRQLHERPLP